MDIYYLSNIIFFGFAVYSVYYVIFKWFPFWKNNPIFQKIEEATITLVSLAGLIYGIAYLFETLSILFGSDIEAGQSLKNRLTGKYSYGVWFQPLMYVLASQLLRIKKIASNVILRLVIAFLLFVNFEKFVIIITSLHRDYLPSSWTMFGEYSLFGWIMLDWIFKIIIFSSFVTLTYYLKSRKTL